MKNRIRRYINMLWVTLVVSVAVASGALIMSLLLGEEATAAEPDIYKGASDDRTTAEINVGAFNRVEVTSAIDVVYSQEENPGVVQVIGSKESIDLISLTVEDGLLKIGYTGNGNQGTMVVTMSSPRLCGVNTSGASSFTIDGSFQSQDTLKLVTRSASTVNLGEVEVKALDIDAVSASRVYVLMTDAQSVAVQAQSASDVKLRGLNVNKVTANASSASNIVLSGRCNESIVNATTGGNVNTRGLIRETSPIVTASYPTRKSGRLKPSGKMREP